MARRYYLQFVQDGVLAGEAKWYAEQLIAANLHTKAFYDGSVKCAEDFYDLARNPNVYLFLAIDAKTGNPAAHMHLTNFSGRTAHSHFSIHPAYKGSEAVRVALEGLDQIFELERAPGEALVTTLIGITPVQNVLAIRLLKICGYTPLTTIEDICEFEDGSFQAGLISTRVR